MLAGFLARTFPRHASNRVTGLQPLVSPIDGDKGFHDTQGFKLIRALSWGGSPSMTGIYRVDDPLQLRCGLHALLETAGHQGVDESSNSTQSVVVTQQQAQIMLLDLGRGGRSGFEVLLELKRRDSPANAVVREGWVES